MPVDPSQIFGPTLFPVPGWLRTGLVDGIPITIESYDIEVMNNFVTQNFLGVVTQGAREKTLHARGTTEVTFRIIGELTVESGRLAYLLSAYNRGYIFNVVVQQFGIVDLLIGCVADNFNLSASANGPVKYSLSGRCYNYPKAGTIFPASYQRPIPGWSSGNSFVESWTITHQIGLTPVWRNGNNVLPNYYRLGNSEYTFQFTSVYQYQEHDIISFGMGNVTITGMVTSRGMSSAGDEVRTYPVSVTNVDVGANTFLPDPTAPGAIVVVDAVPYFSGYPDGV